MKFEKILIKRSIAVGILGALAVPLGACSSFDSLSSLNPFAGEKYETKILADVPADSIYDQGVARLDKKDTSGAAKKFGELEKDYAYSDWARKGLLMEAAAQFQGG